MSLVTFWDLYIDHFFFTWFSQFCSNFNHSNFCFSLFLLPPNQALQQVVHSSGSQPVFLQDHLSVFETSLDPPDPTSTNTHSFKVINYKQSFRRLNRVDLFENAPAPISFLLCHPPTPTSLSLRDKSVSDCLSTINERNVKKQEEGRWRFLAKLFITLNGGERKFLPSLKGATDFADSWERRELRPKATDGL